MRLNQVIIISAILSLILFACAGSKSVQKIDGPEDYYEAETSAPGAPSVTNAETTPKTEDKKGSEKSITTQPVQTPAPVSKTKQDKTKSGKNENISTPVKIEENPVPPEVQEELGDDNWGKDDEKVKLRKKDKEKIKDSSPDDDKWGRE